MIHKTYPFCRSIQTIFFVFRRRQSLSWNRRSWQNWRWLWNYWKRKDTFSNAFKFYNSELLSFCKIMSVAYGLLAIRNFKLSYIMISLHFMALGIYKRVVSISLSVCVTIWGSTGIFSWTHDNWNILFCGASYSVTSSVRSSKLDNRKGQ